MKRIVLIVLLVMLIILTACGGDDDCSDESKVNEKTPTITSNQRPEEVSINPTATVTVTAVPTVVAPASNEIVWGAYMFSCPEKESRDRINELLVEKGYDCTIRFVDMDSGVEEEVIAWIDNYESEKGAVDIFSSGAWWSICAGHEFVKSRFAPLNEYLDTVEGKQFLEFYCQGDLDTVTDSDGVLYAAPRSHHKTGDYENFNAGIYLSVNKKYESYFSEFDGTYLSLQKIYNSIGEPKLKIIFQNFEDSLLAGTMGYQYFNGFPYDAKKHCFVDLSESGMLRETLEALISDIKAGIIVHKANTKGIHDEDILATVHSGVQADTESTVEFCLAEDPYYLNMRMCYGVSGNSTQKDIAAKILFVCFTDPDIAPLMNPYSDDSKYMQERLSLTKDLKASDFAGFELHYSEDYELTMAKYYMNVSDQLISSNLGIVMNFGFDPKSVYKKYSSDEYRLIIRDLNRKMGEHLSKKGASTGE